MALYKCCIIIIIKKRKKLTQAKYIYILDGKFAERAKLVSPVTVQH